jgi:hypothetical protein
LIKGERVKMQLEIRDEQQNWKGWKGLAGDPGGAWVIIPWIYIWRNTRELT